MEWLSNLVQSFSNGWGVLVLLILVGAGYLVAKKGHLKIHTEKFSLGDVGEQERFCLMMQWKQINSMMDGIACKLPEQFRHTDKCKLILARVADIFQETIMVNHIRKDDVYKGVKLSLVINAVLKRTDDPYFQSPEFYDLAKNFTYSVIDELYKIRHCYSNVGDK